MRVFGCRWFPLIFLSYSLALEPGCHTTTKQCGDGIDRPQTERIGKLFSTESFAIARPSDELPQLEAQFAGSPTGSLATDIAQRYFGAAQVAETHRRSRCVDLYFQAARYAWYALELNSGFTCQVDGCQHLDRRMSCLQRIQQPLGFARVSSNHGHSGCGSRIEDAPGTACSSSCQTVLGNACSQSHGLGCLHRNRCGHGPVVDLYNRSVGRCLDNAVRYRRWQPGCGRLNVCTSFGRESIRLDFSQTPWRPDQFETLEFLAPGRGRAQTLHGQRCGLGAPLLATYRAQTGDPCSEHFLPDVHPFPVTVLLRFDGELGQPHLIRTPTATFHDPVRQAVVTVPGGTVSLAARNPAALRAFMKTAAQKHNPYLSYVLPDVWLPRRELYFLEPYQPDKIPLVFVHGFISEPSTWLTMINRLQCDAELMSRYQIWLYYYPTSPPVIENAAALRQDLKETLCQVDPRRADAALSRMVLVGGSMGGLMAKLQVTASGDVLWNAFSDRPYAAIDAEPETRRFFADLLYFEPQPFVERVVYIATPHRGTAFPNRLIACVGQALAGHIDESEEFYRDLAWRNRGEIKGASFLRIPTSVRSLTTDNEMLMAIDRLPYRPGVVRHSIIGEFGCLSFPEPTDGVVAVSSARTPGVVSEVTVQAYHDEVNDHPAACEELRRILWDHLAADNAVPKLPDKTQQDVGGRRSGRQQF